MTEKKTKLVTFWVKKSEYEKYHGFAHDLRISLSEFIRQAINEKIKKDFNTNEV